MTTITATQTALAMIQLRSTKDLIRDFILTGVMIDSQHHDPNLFTVRGWLMDEIERRDPKGYCLWLDSDEDDEALTKYIKQ